MNYYDSIAAGYNELHGKEQERKLSIIKEWIPKNAKILDVGCGTFFSYDYLGLDVFGLEPSKDMVSQHPRFQEFLKTGRIVIEPAEKISLLFEENSFDAVICMTSAHHFVESEKVLLGINEIVRKNGIIIFSLLKNGSEQDLAKLISDFFQVEKKVDEGKDLIIFCRSKHT